MLAQAEENLKGVTEFVSLVENVKNELLLFKTSLVSLSDDLIESVSKREKELDELQESCNQTKRELVIQRLQIENEKKAVEQSQQELRDERRKLESDKGTVQRAIERLKQGKI